MLEMGCAQRPKNRNHKRIQNLKSDTVDVKGELPPLSPQDFDELDRRILKAGKKGGPKGFKKFGIDCKKFNKKYQGQLFGNPCYDKKKIKGIFGPKKGFLIKRAMDMEMFMEMDMETHTEVVTEEVTEVNMVMVVLTCTILTAAQDLLPQEF